MAQSKPSLEQAIKDVLPARWHDIDEEALPTGLKSRVDRVRAEYAA